jgi:glucokinase
VLLAGDIGGTNTRLALYRDDAPLSLVHSATYESRSFSTLEEIILRFLKTSKLEPPSAACFAVAGAVVGGQVRTTNLPWVVREGELERRLNIGRVALMNDLEAAAHGVMAISDPSDLLPLQYGNVAEDHGARALIAAGTGLGVALMPWDGARYRVSPSEGGHASFAPQNEVEDALLTFLRAELGHVSVERVVSGPGLANIYRFLREYRGVPEPQWLTDRIAGGDPSPVISAAALAHEDAVCDEALTIFSSVYGAAAGSVALTALAVGGVFIGGGIAPKILPRLRDGAFLDAFAHKGRFSEAMRRIPVQVVLAPNVALLGAAECAREARQG